MITINVTLGLIIVIVLFIIVNIAIMTSIVNREYKKIKRDNDAEELPSSQLSMWLASFVRMLYLESGLIILQALLIGFFWGIPTLLVIFIPREFTVWAFIVITSNFIIFFVTKKYSGYRGLVSMIAHLAVLLLGWVLRRWLGILFISVPLLAIFYYLLYRLAEIVIPASDPESRPEKMQRFKIFIWYMWGLQYPIIVTPNQPNTKIVTRIPGSIFQSETGVPGYIWTNAYQIAGLTDGTAFSRVEGPGAIYTNRFERVKEVMDLRTHLRATDIDAMTRNGIMIRVTVFASFCIVSPRFDDTLRTSVRTNGSYPYSIRHIYAAFRLEGVNANAHDSTKQALRWDDQVIGLIEEKTRHIIAETSLEELWRPAGQENERGVSSLDLISAKIGTQLKDYLKRRGVHLFSARIVNYSRHTDSAEIQPDSISAENIKTWRSKWEQRLKQKISEVTIEVEQKQLETAAQERLLLLKSISDTLNTSTKASSRRYLIAMRFLDILDLMIREQPDWAGEKGKEILQSIAMVRGNA